MNTKTMLVFAGALPRKRRRPADPVPGCRKEPLQELSLTQLAAFIAGRAEFDTILHLAGPGPMFNDTAAASATRSPTSAASAPRP
jgi:hypothetical protein